MGAALWMDADRACNLLDIKVYFYGSCDSDKKKKLEACDVAEFKCTEM